MMLPAKRSGTVYGAHTIRSPPIRSSGMPSVHAVWPEMRYRTSTVALRFSSPVMSHSKPRQISVGGSITNWPVVTPLPARTGDVTITSASGTRMCFMELLPQLASASPRSASVGRKMDCSVGMDGRSICLDEHLDHCLRDGIRAAPDSLDVVVAQLNRFVAEQLATQLDRDLVVRACARTCDDRSARLCCRTWSAHSSPCASTPRSRPRTSVCQRS